MKIRLGFISNSSSSCFVIRGVCIKVSEIPKQINGLDVYKGLDICSCDPYGYEDEDENKDKECILGKILCSPEDFELTLIPDINDDDIKEKLSKISPEIANREIRTYVRYVSNDNC